MGKEKYGNGYVNTLKQEISFRGKKINFYIQKNKIEYFKRKIWSVSRKNSDNKNKHSNT